MRLSRAQHDVLAWLAAYPYIRLCAHPGGRVSWSASWHNEEARQNMVKVTSVLGIDTTSSAPKASPREGPTPRITAQTFRALQKRSLLQMVSYRPRVGIMTAQYNYTISKAGIKALLNEAHQ